MFILVVDHRMETSDFLETTEMAMEQSRFTLQDVAGREYARTCLGLTVIRPPSVKIWAMTVELPPPLCLLLTFLEAKISHGDFSMTSCVLV